MERPGYPEWLGIKLYSSDFAVCFWWIYLEREITYYKVYLWSWIVASRQNWLEVNDDKYGTCSSFEIKIKDEVEINILETVPLTDWTNLNNLERSQFVHP